MKKILIVGAGSYIGTSLEQYLMNCENCEVGRQYEVHTLDAVNLKPTEENFIDYDVVFYVAGIAHRKETKENAQQYYEVNRDLAIEVATKAKEAGVKQYILMSSMSVYGVTTGYITKTTKPKPVTHYGRSKLQADRKIWKLRDDNFSIVILRPPMVYGKGCRGNYQKIRKFVLLSPVFPDIINQRSMIYIGNLCEFIKAVVDEEKDGLFFPQNYEYVSTGKMVKCITDIHGKRIRLTRIFGIILGILPFEVIKKAFGNLTYEKVDTIKKYSFSESIKATEGKKEGINFWIFHHYASLPSKNGYIRPFRFAQHLKKEKIRTAIFVSSYHHWSDENVIKNGALYKIEYADQVPFIFVRTPSSAAGNIARVKNMAAFALRLGKVTRQTEFDLGRPDVILASSPHPFTMIAGILLARKYKIPCICEIRDLWPEAIFYAGKISEKNIIGKIMIFTEHWIYKHADALIFTKEGDTDYLREKKWTTGQGGDINLKKCFYINNGVDLNTYDNEREKMVFHDADLEDDSFKIIYAGAIRLINNVENIVEAAKLLPKESNIKILIYGDGNFREELEKKVRDENIRNVKFKGYVDQKYIPFILSVSSANLLNYTDTNYNWSRGNSSNKLFEYLASGKPVISTIKTGYSIIQKYDCGIEMESGTPEELARSILYIQSLNHERYEELCINARRAAQDFDYGKLSEKLNKVISSLINNYK